VLACAAAALVYRNALDAPFVFDDGFGVLLNPSLLNPLDLRGVLTHDLAHPVVNLSYAADDLVWGLGSLGFHVTNAVLHLVVVGLFFGVCTRALADGDSRRGPAPEWPAFLASAIFAVHPVVGTAVVYVSARSELLAAAGMLAALTFARRAIVSSSAAAGVVAVACGILALGSSSAAAALPLLVLAYDAWILRDAGWRGRAARIYAPALVLSALAAAWQLHAANAMQRVPPRSIGSTVLAEGLVFWRYLGLLFYPHAQALVHQVRWPAPSDVLALAAFALAAVAAIGIVRLRHSRPVAAFGGTWFLAALAPSLLVPLPDGMAEPRLYAAAPGLFLACASLAAVPIATSRSVRALGVAVAVLLGVVTCGRNRLWGDPLALWQEAVVRSPDAWQAHLGYGEILRGLDRCEAARGEYLEVLRISPGQPDAVAGLGACR
jgi:protein O-mannosyl-transferase